MAEQVNPHVNNDVLQALYEAYEFAQDQEDVIDGDYGMPAPNKAMQLARILRDALHSIGERPDEDDLERQVSRAEYLEER